MSDVGEVGPVDDATADRDPVRVKPPRTPYGWLSVFIATVFGLLYAYDLWEAVSNLVALPLFYDAYGYGSENVPWWLLWIGVLIPVAVFVVALLAGRHRTVFARALIFLVGLAVVAGLSIGVLALEELLRPVLVAVVG
jgi:hypothetical protein